MIKDKRVQEDKPVWPKDRIQVTRNGDKKLLDHN